MIKSQPERLKGLRLGVVALNGFVEVDTIWEGLAEIGHQTEIALQHQMLHRGQSSAKFCKHRCAIDIAPAVGHAVARNQHLGRNLLEAVEHGMGSHVGRTNAPDSPDADSGQEGKHGLGCIGQIGCNAVTRLHTLLAQMQGQ